MARYGKSSKKIFSHVLYQLSYLGICLRTAPGLPKPGRYS